MKIKRIKFAFTLSEVLITLSIIGIIAAITLPIILHKYKKTEMETRLKKTYSVLSQALLMSVAKDGYLITDDFTDANDEEMKEWFEYYMKPYLKIEKVCYNETGCWHEGKTKTLNNNYATLAKESVGIGTNIFVFILNTGITVNGDVWSKNDTYNYFGVKSDNKSLVLYIDINGIKFPNTIGKDIFIFIFAENGLVPAGNDMTREEIDENCSASGNGYYCAAKIMLNSWQFSDENL